MRVFKALLAAALTAGSALLSCPVAFAHDSPEHEVDEITERINAEGESADLLLQRAVEYNVLGKTTEAFKDLERALHFEAHSPLVLRELSRAHLGFGRTNEALENATRGLKYAAPGVEHAALLMTRSDVFRVRKEYQKALEDADSAIKEHQENAEWYLARSQLHLALGLKKERIKGLDAGVKETGSGLIEAEWLDALIDGGKGDLALARIEAELKDARLQSTWLIRRAKVRIAQNKKIEAKADLEAALAEVNQRLGRSSSDPLLLMDRGQIQELLGNKDDAKKDYESARDKGVVDEWLRERLKSVGAKDKKDEGSSGSRRSRSGEKKADDQEGAKPEDNKDESKEEQPADGDEKK